MLTLRSGSLRLPQGLGVYPEEDPLALGMLGMHGARPNRDESRQDTPAPSPRCRCCFGTSRPARPPACPRRLVA